ncbi:MAG: hypothetical protein HEQ35_22035 [Gloeotrichia echinulata IR180]|jgi:hypothetical protein|nr:hypothetical protein [Gloeotrichia echinulata DEX184]
MRVKVLNVLTVCAITLAVLSPEILVLSIVWGRHIELIKTQSLTCEINNNIRVYDALALQSEGKNIPQSQASIKISDCALNHQKPITVQQYQFTTILQLFFVLTPICLGLGIMIYDRYLVYRAAVLREQVETLERLWQQSIEQ